jgi:hypothetical protein
MWGSFLIKTDNCKNLTKWILLAHHVQGHACILQDLWKLSKVVIYFKTSHDAFKSYSCHWDLWLLGYRFHGSISSIIWFLFFFIKCKNCIDQKEAGDQQYKEKGTKVPWPNQKQDKLAEQKAKGTDSLVQTISKARLLNRKAKGTDSLKRGTESLEQPKQDKLAETESKGNRLPCTTENQREQAPLNTGKSS